MITELVTDMVTNKGFLIRLFYQFMFKKSFKLFGIIRLDADNKDKIVFSFGDERTVFLIN